jgi:alpha-beta hydrolase superfamily lysophospholipase
VAALYLDAPALDLRSWPGHGTARWPDVAASYGLTVEAMETARVSPLDRIAPVAAAGIPIIGVSGDADPIVRHEENLAVLAERYRAAGGRVEIILKPGAGHSPHSLPDPTPIVDFLLEHAKWLPTPNNPTPNIQRPSQAEVASPR